jgi:hypothetical protein
VSETITIEKFPAHKVGLARETLNGLYAKLAKAAVKAGATPLPMPTLEASAPESVFACNKCYARSIKAALGKDCAKFGECEGFIVEAKLVTLTVTAARPALAGWEFLAVVEPLEGGNLVRRVPGADDAFDLTSYRSCAALTCEHCNTVRKRLETFVVRADGSDPAVAAGTVKRVGRNCLASFLGGVSPEWLLRGLSIEKVLSDLGGGDGEGGGWGRAPEVYDPLMAMAWSCSTVRLRGWVSKAAAQAYYEAANGEAAKTPTASRVASMLGPPPFHKEARAEWLAERAVLEPTPADVEKAAAVLEWTKSLTGATDYEYSLSLVCKQPMVDPAKLGIFVSAVGSYDRAMGFEARKAAEAAEKVAAPLGKVEFEGEIIKTSVVTQRFGYNETSVDKMTVKVTTDTGVWLAWGTIPANMMASTMNDLGQYIPEDLVGRKVKIKATLEAGKDAHFVFMKRPSVEFSDVYGPVFKAPKVKKPKAPKAPKCSSCGAKLVEGKCEDYHCAKGPWPGDQVNSAEVQ